MPRLDTLKVVTLALLIGLACLLRGEPARAAGSEVLTVAGGCFWCVESDFESVPGVSEVISGYTGGTLKNPTYADVSHGGSGHYEAVQIHFDPARVSREQLLRMYFRAIDPTDAGGQFCDRGDSYRTAVFVSGKAEQALAESARDEAQTALGQKVVTKILPAGKFYPAEGYHQNYYKGTRIVLTRAGPKRQSSAYAFYRRSCGRDQRVHQLWGDQAPFVGKHG